MREIYMKQVLREIRKSLRAAVDVKYKVGAERYFKEKINLYGVRLWKVEKIAKQFWPKIKDWDKVKIWQLCEELWKSGMMEESWIAANWAYALRKNYSVEDFKVFEKWVNQYVTNWASCDTFCNHAIGEFIEQFPEFIKELKRWAKSKNRWVKRAAAVTLIIPARKGKFLKDIFEIADILLTDKDDLVQKGYGWMLKEASKKYQRDVFAYVTKNKAVMSRTALRYTIEKMPPDMRKKALVK